jgi:hypothetical protein
MRSLTEGGFHTGQPVPQSPSTTASRRSPSPYRGG